MTGPAAPQPVEPPPSPRRIVSLWLPMAGTWLMMSLEAPFLAALIARLADPKPNLAAFGVAYTVAILVEAPVIMILSASTALVTGACSYRRLRDFTFALSAAVTVAMGILLLGPVWSWVGTTAIGLSREVASATHAALLLLLPWPAAIGYRRFYQGLLIRRGRTRLVAYGTLLRLGAVTATGAALFAGSDLPGAMVGAAAAAAGVSVEAVAGRFMARRVVRSIRAVDSEQERRRAPTQRQIARFYTPLALTSVLSLAVHPAVTLFVGHARHALESLAVLPVVHSLTFLFRSAGLSFQEVAIALLGRGDERTVGPLVRFAAWLGLAASAGLAAIAFTPLARFWFEDLSGLTPELGAFALTPTRILAVLPALSVLLSLERALLVHRRLTPAITRATGVEVAGILLTLALTVVALDWVGATAAATAILAGRVAGNLVLVPPCLEVMREAQSRVSAVGRERL